MKIKRLFIIYIFCFLTQGVLILVHPQVLFAQNKLPFIESITSDTLKGKYQQILFTYNQDKRVSNIIQTQCKTQKASPNEDLPLIDTISIQTFTYDESGNKPSSRKTTCFKYDPAIKSSVWTFTEMRVFIYKDGKHIQDSIVYKENELHLKGEYIGKDNVYNWKGTLTYSSNSFNYLLDRNYLTRRMYDYQYGAETEVLINKQQNIEKESEKELIKSHSSSNPPYYTYTKFDNAINPFRYLNISEIFPNEKITLSYNVNGLIGKKEEFLNLGNTDFNWYYFNQNNIISYSITRGETDSEFKDVIRLSYTYNKFKLPIYCKAEIRKEFTKDGTLAGKHQKRFTFRYRT